MARAGHRCRGYGSAAGRVRSASSMAPAGSPIRHRAVAAVATASTAKGRCCRASGRGLVAQLGDLVGVALVDDAPQHRRQQHRLGRSSSSLARHHRRPRRCCRRAPSSWPRPTGPTGARRRRGSDGSPTTWSTRRSGPREGALLVEALEREAPHGLQQPERVTSAAARRPRARSRRAAARRSAPVVETGVGADGVGQLGGERSGEQAQPVEHGGDVGGQQPVGPVDGVGEAAVAADARKRGRASTSTPSAEPGEDLRRCIVRVRRGGELEGERQAVEVPAELGDASSWSSSTAAPASRARSRNSRTASLSTSAVPGRRDASGPSTTSDSSGRSSGERLVARTVGASQASSRSAMASAAGAVTCSQLSTRSAGGARSAS